nr:odorant receptor 46 [Podabrus annulatus]
MKPFNIDEIVENIKVLMLYVGIWPEEVPTIRYTLRALISFTTTTLLTLFLVLQGYRHFTSGDIANAVFELCLILVCGFAAFEVCYLHSNKKQFLKIFEDLRDPALIAHDDDFDDYVQNNVFLVTRLYKFFLYACVSTAVAIVICDLIYDYKTGPRTIAITASDNDIFPYILVFAWYLYGFGIIFTATIVGAFHGLTFTLIFVADAHFEILYRQIISATKYDSSNYDDEEEMNKKANNLLRICVIRHNAIERFLVSIENGLSFSFLIQLLVTLTLTALVGFSFFFVSVKSPNFIRCLFFFVADVIQLAMLCFACNEVILKSEKIRDACYMSDWNKYNTSVCKTLFIIMERSKRPLCFTAGKFAVISLETFITILKMSMSYFTLLKSVYEDSK